MDKMKFVLVVVLCLGIGWFAHAKLYPQKNKPIREAIAKAIRWIPFVAPLLLLDEGPPQDEMRFFDPTEMYGQVPEREIGSDGYEILNHGEEW